MLVRDEDTVELDTHTLQDVSSEAFSSSFILTTCFEFSISAVVA